jgi:uroporphyrinogen decarboxylase
VLELGTAQSGGQQKQESMTSRERVLKATRHESVDRMPIDLGSTTSSSINAFAYWDLRKYLGLSLEPIEIRDIVQFTPRLGREILERFHCDAVALQPYPESTHVWNPRGDYQFLLPKHVQPEKNADGDWVANYGAAKIRMSSGAYHFDILIVDRSLIVNKEDELIARTTSEAEKLYHGTDYYLTFSGFSGYFQLNPEWLTRLMLEKEVIKAENESLLEKNISKVEKVIKYMGEYIQAVRISCDLGTQRGPWCDPALMEEAVMPYFKRFCDYVHSHSDLSVHLHSCGGIRPLIPMLIDCGIDILNPVQVSAANMDPHELKEEFGGQLSFWGGGCDTQRILRTNDNALIAENVEFLTETFKPGSGYVFTQVHNILGNVEPKSVVTMLDTAYKHSFYTASTAE